MNHPKTNVVNLNLYDFINVGAQEIQWFDIDWNYSTWALGMHMHSYVYITGDGVVQLSSDLDVRTWHWGSATESVDYGMVHNYLELW